MTTEIKPFNTADQVKAHIAGLDPKIASIQPHYSASYLWEVRCPGAFGRVSYGFSTEESLVSWANQHLAPADAGE